MVCFLFISNQIDEKMLFLVVIIIYVAKLDSTESTDLDITWYERYPLPFHWKNGAYGVHDDTLYILGGIDGNNQIYSGIRQYNFTSQLWLYSAVNDNNYRSFELWNAGFTVSGSILYWIPRHCMDYCNSFSIPLFSYNMNTNQYNILSNTPGGSGTGAVCSHDNYIYSIGGWRHLNPHNDYTHIRNSYVYNITDNTWSDLPDLVYGSAQGVCYYTNNEILYLFGMWYIFRC